jgi:hypothetical protein
MTTTFRCLNCWQSYECDEHGHCLHCGEDMHRPWPWNALVVGCPVTQTWHDTGPCPHGVTFVRSEHPSPAR